MVRHEVKLKSEIWPDEGYTASRGDVIFGVMAGGRMPLGRYELKIVFEDEAGADSEPQVLEVTMTR